VIISISFDKGVVRINNEFASSVPEFSALLEDAELGAPYLAYVAYFTDPADDCIYSSLPEEVRRKKLIDKLKLDGHKLKNKKVVDALKEYKDFCKKNITYRFMSDYVGGLQKVAKYIEKTDLDGENVGEYTKALKEMPTLLKGKEELAKATSKEQRRGVVTGDKKLTLNESQN